MNVFGPLIELLLLAAGTFNGDFTVDDLPDEEMELREFRFAEAEPDLNISKGEEVVIVNWFGDNGKALCFHEANGGVQLSIKKYLLEPIIQEVNGIRKYRVGLARQQSSVKTSYREIDEQQQKIVEWNAKENEYTANETLWVDEYNIRQAELIRREGILSNREARMSRLLVRETMYNRFDSLILKWVNHYNSTFNPSQPLDPNIVKSMIFEESKMGTSGKFLLLPPLSWNDEERDPLKSRFNLGQAIDSAGPQQYLMIKEIAPAIYLAGGLNALETNQQWAAMKNTEYNVWNGGAYILALKEFMEHRAAGDINFIGNQGKDLNLDYEFWIRTAVRWLFYKYQTLSSPNWSQAVKSYNGSGSKADNYRRAVMKRVGTLTDLKL